MNRPDLELDEQTLEMIEQDGLPRWIRPLQACTESPEQMLLKIRGDYKHIAPSFLVIAEQGLVRPLSEIPEEEYDFLNYGFCFAAEFGDERFSDALLQFATHDDEEWFDMVFGEFVVSDFPEWFAAICGHDLDAIAAIATDPDIVADVRSSALGSLEYLAARDRYPEKRLKEELKKISELIENDDPLWNSVAGVAMNLGWGEFEPVLTDAWERGALDPTLNGDLKAILGHLQKNARRRRDNPPQLAPYDAVKTIVHWWKSAGKDSHDITETPGSGEREAAPHGLASGLGRNSGGALIRKAPKVSRNSPCPCGSGKKFKKCCG